MADQSAFAFGPGSAWVVLNQYTDGTSPAVAQPLKFDVMQDCMVDFDRSIKELWGQLQFPRAIANADGKVNVKIHQARFIPGLWQAEIGQPGNLAAGTSLMWSDDDQGTSHTIPASMPYTISITPPSSGTFLKDWGVRFASTGQELKKVASMPTTGQYSVSSTTYTFAAADTSLVILISYEYTITTGSTYTYQNILQGATPFAAFRYQGTYGGRDVGVYLPNTVGAKFDFPSKQKDWMISEMDFSAFADSSNIVGYLYSTEVDVGV